MLPAVQVEIICVKQLRSECLWGGYGAVFTMVYLLVNRLREWYRHGVGKVNWPSIVNRGSARVSHIAGGNTSKSTFKDECRCTAKQSHKRMM